MFAHADAFASVSGVDDMTRSPLRVQPIVSGRSAQRARCSSSGLLTSIQARAAEPRIKPRMSVGW